MPPPTPRGSSLMKVLTETSYLSIKKEVEEMTPKEASEIWSHIEPFFPGVCVMAGASNVGMRWTMLVRKMSLIQRKAEEAEG